MVRALPSPGDPSYQPNQPQKHPYIHHKVHKVHTVWWRAFDNTKHKHQPHPPLSLAWQLFWLQKWHHIRGATCFQGPNGGLRQAHTRCMHNLSVTRQCPASWGCPEPTHYAGNVSEILIYLHLSYTRSYKPKLQGHAHTAHCTLSCADGRGVSAVFFLGAVNLWPWNSAQAHPVLMVEN